MRIGAGFNESWQRSDNSRRIEMVGIASQLNASRISALKREVLIFSYLSKAAQ
jgi:hypothetical protein